MLYANLKTEMLKRNITSEELSKKLSISHKLFLDKMHCIKDFTLGEIKIILELFNGLSYDYLFKKTD